METETGPVGPIETDDGSRNEISSEKLTHFILGATCTASLMHLSHKSEPYGHGAIAFLLTKSLLKSLEMNCCDAPLSLIRLNETTCKLANFIPWTLLNTELYRQSGLLDGWNEAYFGFLLAASVPSALAATELKEKYYSSMVSLVNGVNLLALGYLASRQQNCWGLGMTAVCALDSFCLSKVARCVRISEPNTRNVLRSFFAGMLPFYLKSL